MTSAEVAVASGCRHGFPAGTCPLCGEQGEEQQLRRGGEEKAACYPDEAARRAAWAAGWEQLPCEAATGPAPSAEEVEEAFISALDGVETLLALREKLAGLLGSGAFGIAQARYSLGANRVGQAQYPAIIEPTFCVATSGQLPEERMAFSRLEGGLTQALEELKLTRSEEQHEGSGKEEGRRADGKRNARPLNWFGVAVPPGLRAAQADFGTALGVALEVAAAQVEVQRRVSAYCSLRRAAE